MLVFWLLKINYYYSYVEKTAGSGLPRRGENSTVARCNFASPEYVELDSMIDF